MNSPINLTEWPHEKIKSKKILELAEEVLHSNEYVGNYFKFDKDWIKYDRYCGSASLSLTSKIILKDMYTIWKSLTIC